MRDITISGSFSSRDLGGYHTPQGPTIWRKVYRSGNMAHVNEAGLATLKQLGITRVIDLRSQKEREVSPDPYGADSGIGPASVSFWSF